MDKHYFIIDFDCVPNNSSVKSVYLSHSSEVIQKKKKIISFEGFVKKKIMFSQNFSVLSVPVPKVLILCFSLPFFFGFNCLS